MQILDFHCHVYPHAIAEKAAEAVAQFYQVHRGVEIPEQTASLDDVLQAQAEAGIAKDRPLLRRHSSPTRSQHINEFLARKAAASGGRCLSLARFIPTVRTPGAMWSICWKLGLARR